MRNADLVRGFASRAAPRAELQAAEQALEREARRLAALRDKVEQLERVTEIIDGVAIYRPLGYLAGAGDDIRRAASVYPNAHNNGTTFGVSTYDDFAGARGERWHGAAFTREQPEHIAREWVVRGIRPAR